MAVISISRRAALALAPLAWLVAIPLAHGVAPWAISLLGPRHGWHGSNPGAWNLLGLAPVSAGAIVLAWLMAFALAQARKLPERVELNWRPKILLTGGPYAFSRHPMYLGEMALWLGWAILFGSPTVFACFLLFCIVVPRLGRGEERDLEAKFDEQYREYARRVPRWLGLPTRGVNVGRYER